MEPPPVVVDGDWSPDQTRTVKNKLQIYFQSRKKSSGGDCRVEAEDGASRAAVFFKSEEVRSRVLEKGDHQIILDNKTIALRLSSAASSASDQVSDSKTQDSSKKLEAGKEAAAENKQSSASLPPAFLQPSSLQPSSLHSSSLPPSAAPPSAVVLNNVSEATSRDLLIMLVENISGLDETDFSLEIIWESNKAVISFSRPADAEKFLSGSRSSQKLQKHGLSAQRLAAAVGVRVEGLPPTVVKEMLELFFEKDWMLPDRVVMIPSEQAAIVTFNDPKVVGNICVKQAYVLRSIPIKVYPYYESLGAALYGEERPTWKLPDSFTESVHHVIWRFLVMKNLLQSINTEMGVFFCSVDLEKPEVKLRPLPALLRQKGLTSQRLAEWSGTARDAFRKLMSKYTAFDCTASARTWKTAEQEVRLLVKDDAFLVPDATRELLTVAGRVDDIKRLRALVENIVLRVASQIQRQTDGISDVMVMSPAMFYILNQLKFQEAARDISPELKMSFDAGASRLTLTGLPAEVFQAKSWILEKNGAMSKKQLDIPPSLLDFLQTVDATETSHELFTANGISAIYSLDNRGLTLTASSESSLAAAEQKMKSLLGLKNLDVEDQEVLKLHLWVKLNQQLLDAYNSTKKTVVVQTVQRDQITVAGFQEVVNQVADSLKEFLENYSRVRQTIRVDSRAVVQFLLKKKLQDWSSVAKDNDVQVQMDPERPKIVISGARLHVQKVKSCFRDLTSKLATDHFSIDKPGAKKYFLSQGSLFLSTIMTEFSCMVVLGPDIQEEDDDEEEVGGRRDNAAKAHCYCRVKTAGGVLVSVSRADICSFAVDAVVNAANEDLDHIGGLALALLQAAGPELQKTSRDHVARHGKLGVGDAVVTGAFNLPCKHVIHAVGPRFSEYDRKTAVMKLKLAVKNSLTQANGVKCSSVALPAISSGVFGFPLELCGNTIAEAVRENCDGPGGPGQLTEIHLVDTKHERVEVLAKAVNRVFGDLGPTMTMPVPGSATGAAGYQPSRGETGGRGAEGGGAGGRGAEGRGAQTRGAGGRGAEGGGRGGDLQGVGNWGGQSSRGPTGGSGRMELTTAEGLRIILLKGNIEDQTTDVIVNTISDNVNLNQGAVSKAILAAAGGGLQTAVLNEAGVATLPFGHVVITDGFKLMCRKVFHAVCPSWNDGAAQAQEELTGIIRYCLLQAEKLAKASLAFPAIGTGNLNFPRAVVSRVLLQEIQAFSRRSPLHLRTVSMVVHPSDSQTVDCFFQEFRGQPAPRRPQREAQESPVRQAASQSESSSGHFGPVSSPLLGVYQMQMGQLTLEVSSGDITKEACDAIINSSNQDFTLKSGVSKAILDAAGLMVEMECQQIVSSPGFQPGQFILTSGGLLPSRHIIHVVGQNDPAKIREVVYQVLKFCETNKFGSVSFPALGTGLGGVSPSAVADSMVDAVVDFVRKHQKFVRSIKILIFQTAMMAEFHKSMKRREGEEVEEKSGFAKFRAKVTSFFTGEQQPSKHSLVLEREEFEPTMFQLCADNEMAVSQTKKRIQELILAEQAKRTITDPFIGKLSQEDMDQLKALQRKLTVSIHLDQGLEDQEPKIHLEGLTRDVYTAESEVRDVIRKVERLEIRKSKALLVSGRVEWRFEASPGKTLPFDMMTNLILEETLENKQLSTAIKIHNQKFTANVMLRKAVSAVGNREVELLRTEVKDDDALPQHWDDMKGDLLKMFTVKAGSKEYKEVEAELTKTGLNANIISVERVQNTTLWRTYQLMKKQLEMKNQHNNNERCLFHGTAASSVQLINKHGFNRSYAGTHGAMWGNGSYFAVKASYSAQGYAKPDAKKHKRMYLARVLVGDFTQGQAGLITPPAKNSGNAADLYDSVVDHVTNPSMFVVFNDIQAYPEYLITFT